MQSDCFIIETIRKYFEDKNDYELYFCSLNKWDFSNNPKDKDDNLKIHEDIKGKFKNITYYTNLFSLLNKKFQAKYSKKSIKKLKEKEEESRKVDFTNSNLVLGHIDKTGRIIASNAERPIAGNNSLSEMAITGNEILMGKPSWGMGMERSSVSSVASYSICKSCNKVQFGSLLEDGLCDDCRGRKLGIIIGGGFL